LLLLKLWNIFFFIFLHLHSFLANVYYRYHMSRCIYSSSNISDMFDSTLRRFVGFNEYGKKLAESWKNGTFVHEERDIVDWFCKCNAEIFDSSISDKSGKWHKTFLSFLLSTCRANATVQISCMVEHASFNLSLPESERNKIAIGAFGLVLGIIIAAAGLIYYKKKSTGQ
uniref:MHC class II beta chain N-terminal domain-containing protein n=1 Tax=Cyprinus carpio TaxID=7962 RepID=A0A8C1V742_CYPCA